MKKKIVSAFLAVVMFTAGCSSAGGTGENTAATSKETQAGSETKEGASEKEYSLFIGNSWVASIFDPSFQDTVAQELKAKTGVTLKMDTVKSEDAESEINLLLASDDLPDLIMADGPIRSQMIRDGYVIELTDLVESHGQNIKNNLAGAIPDWQEPDGSLYGLGCFVWNDPKYALNLSINTIYMRYDILKELGFEKLERTNEYDSMITVEEYLALLDQVKAKYPDMIPALMNSERSIETMMRAKGTQFTNVPGSTYTSYEDGEAKSVFSSKYLPDVIKFLNQFYRDGYAPEGVLNYSLEENEALLATGEVFSTLGAVDGLDQGIAAFHENGGDSRYVMFYLRDSEEITDLYYNNYATAEGANLMITKNCKDPEGVMEFLNFCASDEGSIIIGAGVEGVTYTKNADGTLTPTEEMAKAYAQWDVNVIKKHGVGNWLNLLPAMEGLKEDGHAYDINAEVVFTSDPWVSYNNKDYLHIAYPRLSNGVGRLDQVDSPEGYAAYSKINAYAFDRIAKAIMAETAEESQAEWEICVKQMQTDGIAELDKALDTNWNELAEIYERAPDALIATEANK